jgi:hypothetical protein
MITQEMQLTLLIYKLIHRKIKTEEFRSVEELDDYLKTVIKGIEKRIFKKIDSHLAKICFIEEMEEIAN